MEKFEENQNEVWRTIDEFPDYEVSNLGRVRNKKTNLIRKLYESKKEYGYKQVSIVFSRKRSRILSRLVAKAFPEICGEWFEGCEVHHLDKNPANNKADNLKVCTVKEHHAYHGGENNPMFGKKHSDSTKEKIKAKAIGRHPSEETRRKMSESHKGEKNYIFGKRFKDSPETCRKKSDSHKGEKNYWYGKSLPRPTIEAAIAKCSKPVNQYTLDGEFLKTWKSSMEIKRELGFSNASIGKCCNGQQKSCHGFIWTFANQDNPD